MGLQELRDQIDQTDAQIVELLNKRAKLAQAVGEVKGGGVKFAPAREAQVIATLLRANTGPFTDESLTAVYREIIACCLSLEQPMRISYLGPEGTYSEEAARRRFGAPAQLVPCATLDEVLLAAEKGQADVAVLPVENSTEGAVNRTLDLLLETKLQIIGEVDLAIHHQLLSKAQSLNSIEVVAAHPQALAQCREWLQRHLPDGEQRAVNSNAEAAKIAADDPSVAAIAGRQAAARYDLPIMAADIEDERDNTTRFLLVGGMPADPTGNDKTSLVCSVVNRPGALGELVAVLSDAGINMTKLGSRPTSTGVWDYVFYIDIDGHKEDAAVAAALQKLTDQTLFTKILGSYPKGSK